MNATTTATESVALHLGSPAVTSALAEWLAPQLLRGDVILLDGPIGAGKTHFCRALIKARLTAANRSEDVPSPTFTLVQVYELPDMDIWHTDLYRLSSSDQAIELGLDEAFENAVTLVEWPDRLGLSAPSNALTLRFSFDVDADSRNMVAVASDPRWAAILTKLANNRLPYHG